MKGKEHNVESSCTNDRSCPGVSVHLQIRGTCEGEKYWEEALFELLPTVVAHTMESWESTDITKSNINRFIEKLQELRDIPLEGDSVSHYYPDGI